MTPRESHVWELIQHNGPDAYFYKCLTCGLEVGTSFSPERVKLKGIRGSGISDCDEYVAMLVHSE